MSTNHEHKQQYDLERNNTLRQPNIQYSEDGMEMEMGGFELGALGPEADGLPMGRHVSIKIENHTQ